MKNIPLIFLLFIQIGVKSQTPEYYSPAAKSVKKLYYEQTFNKHGYINGKEYKAYHSVSGDRPYLESKQGIGNLYINGYTYSKIIMIYDIFKDELVIIPSQTKSLSTYIQLRKADIDSFNIKFDDQLYKLIHLRKDPSFPEFFSPGFYDMQHQGEYTLLIQHSAFRGESEGEVTYNYKPKRYLKKDYKYFDINSRKKLFSVFPAHKKLIKKKQQSIHPNYSKMSRYQLSELIKYAESL